MVLPAATFAEADGTLVNNEGRAQHFYQVFTPPGEIQAELALAAALRHEAVSLGRAGTTSKRR